MPNFSLNAARDRLAQLLGADDARSAGARTARGSHLRMYAAQNVGVLIRIVAVVLLGQLADGLGVHRVGVIDDAEAGDQREPQRAGEAERVEERQHADQHVLRVHVEDLRRSRRRSRGCCGAMSITPFGTPVLPLEKMTVASVVRGRASRHEQPVERRRRQHEGASTSVRDLRARRRTPSCTSSRNTMPSHRLDARLRQEHAAT